MIVSTTIQQTTPAYTKAESSIQKHTRFWDKSNKGYITPLDTISGFITLGYGMIFSVALGTLAGVFLSLSTQTGWVPDPLLRSNTRNLTAKSNNAGAYDQDGAFNPDKFESLFSKYAKTDPSGNNITAAEFIQMTKEQEKLGKNVKAWTMNILELATTYFFIGHRGYLSKEDVRAAYDGSLFYRLTDKNKLLIQDKKRDGSDSLLKGAYLSKPSHIKSLEHKIQVLLSTLQSKSSFASEYGLNEWVNYIQDTTDSIKKHALRRPTHIVNGVSSPKASMYRKSKAHQDPNELFPEGLTGVAKDTGGPNIITEDYLTSLLSGPEELNGEPLMFRNLTKDDNQFVTSSGIIAVNATEIKRSPSDETLDSGYFMSSVLREDDDDTASSLTGVQSVGDDKRSETGEHDSAVEEEREPALTPPPEEKPNEQVLQESN